MMDVFFFQARESLIEIVADFDDGVMEMFLERGDLYSCDHINADG